MEPVSDDYDDLSDLKPSEMEQVKEWELQFRLELYYIYLCNLNYIFFYLFSSHVSFTAYSNTRTFLHITAVFNF